jgi:2-phosphoglycerate kinase
LKTIVINRREGTRTPFLRGILIRSLLDAGLEFDQAYEVATRVREELADVAEVPTDQLRSMVTRRLKKLDPEALEFYQQVTVAPARILVHNVNGSISAFSRGRHTRFLQSSGIRADRAEQTTNLIYDQLLTAGIMSLTTGQLGYLTFLCLQQEISKKAARRFLVWSEFQRSGRPLLVMICGAVGSGKSTIATEVAHLLEIVRIQSTDMLREVMRMMLPERLLPILHTSSFNAWTTLPIQDIDTRSKDQLVAEGYRSQAELLAVPCEAVLHRAVEESVPLILEGVHAHPELLNLASRHPDAILVHVTLAVLKAADLKSRLRGRGVEVPQRRAKRYLNSFDSIWRLQSFLLAEADRCDTPIITNNDKDKAIQQLIQQVNFALAEHFHGTPESIFGSAATDLAGRLPETAKWQDIVPCLRENSDKPRVTA